MPRSEISFDDFCNIRTSENNWKGDHIITYHQ